MNSAKAPRENCIAFAKLDGSNIRVKYTNKKGFNLFGSRTQNLDGNHPFLCQAVPIFRSQFEDKLVNAIEDYWPNEREVVVFGEFFGPRSFAGWHEPDDPKEFVLFDIMIGHKNRKFLLPQEFIKVCNKHQIKYPAVIHEGNLTDQFIKDIKEGKYLGINEGVVCKGTAKTGAHRGNVWMCKIKTQAYIDKLRNKFGDEGITKYGE